MTDENMNLRISQTMHSTADFLLDQAQFLTERGIDLSGDTKMRHLLDQICKIFVPPEQVQPKTRELNSEQAAKERLTLFTELRDAVRNGTANDKFPVGSVLPDVWTDVITGKTYSMPHIIVDYREVNKPRCKKPQPAVILLREHALPVLYCYGSSNDFISSMIAVYLEETYYEGCSAALQSVVKPLILPESKTSKKLTFFLPNPEEIVANTGSTWKFFNDAPMNWYLQDQKRKFTDPNGKPQAYWLRSTGYEPTTEAYIINQDGDLQSLSVCSYEFSCTPACVIY